MIIVRRLTGQPFALNPDLIERIECTPDTILVLTDGTRYIVDDSMDEVIELVREHRASLIGRALQPLTPRVAPEHRTDSGPVVLPMPPRQPGE